MVYSGKEKSGDRHTEEKRYKNHKKNALHKPQNAGARSKEQGLEAILLPSPPQKEPVLLTLWFWTLCLQICEMINFGSPSHLVYRALLRLPQASNSMPNKERAFKGPGKRKSSI